MREKIFEYVKKKYGTEPDYPFISGRTPIAYPVLRHEDNRKIFALFMDVPMDKLGLDGTERVDIINVKMGDPLLADMLSQQTGYFHGYHISRGNWISILLDGTVPFEDICRWIDESYVVTASKQKKQKMRPPKEWIVPANPKYYDIEHAFDRGKENEWSYKIVFARNTGGSIYYVMYLDFLSFLCYYTILGGSVFMSLIDAIKKIRIIRDLIHFGHQKILDHDVKKRYLKADNIQFVINNKNSDRKYLIFNYSGTQGLMAQVESVLAWIKCAIDNQCTLVVNMLDGENLYRVEEENAWENFFHQPMIDARVDRSYLDNILQNENYAFCPTFDRATYYWVPGYNHLCRWFDKNPPIIIHPSTRDYKNDIQLQKEFEYLYSKYILPQDSVCDYLDKEYYELLEDKHKSTIGVIIRGTDYTKVKPYMHPIQPSVDEVIEKVKDLLTNGYKYIYLATDENAVEQRFRNEFPDRVITNTRIYYEADDYTKTAVRNIHFDRENDNLLRGIEYYSSMNLLSKCDVLVGGLCGGSQAALLMNGGKYTEVYLFDKGEYGINDK